MESEYPPGHVHHLWKSLKDEVEEMTKILKENQELKVYLDAFDMGWDVESLGYVGSNLLVLEANHNSILSRFCIHQSILCVQFHIQFKGLNDASKSITFIQGK